jgi:3',5'-cyclic AMP phosphodiesterase CpdA
MSESEIETFAMRDMVVEQVPKVEGFAWDAERYEWSIGVANQLRPQFVVVAGDMVDDIDDEAQVAELFRITARLDGDIPIRWVPGNHDAAFDTVAPTPQSLLRYRELFGDDRYGFSAGSTRFVVLNTPVLDHPEAVPDELSDQMEFLERELAAARQTHDSTILLGHHPLFIRAPDEPDTYWNVPRSQRQPVLDLIHGYDVRIAFAGHWHRNAVAYDGEFEMVTTGPVGYPLGQDPPGYRTVEIGDEVTHEYHPLVRPEPAPGEHGSGSQ